MEHSPIANDTEVGVTHSMAIGSYDESLLERPVLLPGRVPRRHLTIRSSTRPSPRNHCGLGRVLEKLAHTRGRAREEKPSGRGKHCAVDLKSAKELDGNPSATRIRRQLAARGLSGRRPGCQSASENAGGDRIVPAVYRQALVVSRPLFDREFELGSHAMQVQPPVNSIGGGLRRLQKSSRSDADFRPPRRQPPGRGLAKPQRREADRPQPDRIGQPRPDSTHAVTVGIWHPPTRDAAESKAYGVTTRPFRGRKIGLS